MKKLNGKTVNTVNISGQFFYEMKNRRKLCNLNRKMDERKRAYEK